MWTIKTLKKYFELQFKGTEKALKIARKLMNKRLDEMNEVRAQLDRQVRTFVSAERYDGDMRALNAKIDNLKERLDWRKGGSTVWPLIFSILSLVGVSVFIIINILKR